MYSSTLLFSPAVHLRVPEARTVLSVLVLDFLLRFPLEPSSSSDATTWSLEGLNIDRQGRTLDVLQPLPAVVGSLFGTPTRRTCTHTRAKGA
eukprot:scaffold1518_cov331-Pavlova_lutheri.AAC.20